MNRKLGRLGNKGAKFAEKISESDSSTQWKTEDPRISD